MSSSKDSLEAITIARSRLPRVRRRFEAMAASFLEHSGTTVGSWTQREGGEGFERSRTNELTALVGVTARYGFERHAGDTSEFIELARRPIGANRIVGVRETSQVEAVGRGGRTRGEEFLRTLAVRTVFSGISLPTDTPVSDEELRSALGMHAEVSSLGWRHDQVREEYVFGFTPRGNLVGADTTIGGVHTTLLVPLGSDLQDLPGAVEALGVANRRIEEGLGMHLPRIGG